MSVFAMEIRCCLTLRRDKTSVEKKERKKEKSRDISLCQGKPVLPHTETSVERKMSIVAKEEDVCLCQGKPVLPHI